MAKSNSADISDILGYISSQIDQLVGEDPIKLFSTEMMKIIEDKFLKNVNVKDSSNLTKKELREIKEYLKSAFATIGMGTTASSKAFETLFQGAIQKLETGLPIQMDRLAAILSNSISQMISTSEGARAGGKGREYFKASNDLTSKDMVVAVAKAMGMELDKQTHDFLSFVRGEYSNNQKKARKTLADYLIEGLAANKFIGGAMNDTLRLVGFLGASVLKNIPLIGKFIAPVFYGVMQALGPVLTQAVITGIVQGMTASIIGNLFSGLLGRLGGKALGQVGSNLLNKGAMIGWGSQLGEVAVKTAPYSATMTGWGAAGMTTAQTGANIGANTVAQTGTKAGLLRGALGTAGKVAGKVLPALGVLLEGGTAVSEWRKGNKGKASMHGASAALGTAAIVAGATGVGAPVALILGALSIITGLIGAFMKQSKRSDEENKQYQEYMKENNAWLSSDAPQRSLLYGNSPGTLGEEATQNLKRRSKALSTKADEKVARTIGKLQLSKGGAILNARSFTQAEFAKQLELYRKTDPESFNRLYELLPQGTANLNSYTTDAILRNDKGEKVALGYKGATQDLEDARRLLVRGGMSPEKADMLMYSSGMMTGSNVSHSDSGKYNFKSHGNMYGFGFDLAAPKWTREDWQIAYPILKNLYKMKGFDANYEVRKNGKSVFTTPERDYNKSAHIDAKPMKNFKPVGAYVNESVSSTNHNLDVKKAISSLTPEEKNKFTKAIKETPYQGSSKEEYNEYVEGILKKLSSNTNAGASTIVADPTGNNDFLQIQATMANYNNFGCDQVRIG